MNLVEAGVRIGDVLEHAAREHGVERVVLEGEPNRVGCEVRLDLREPLQRLGPGCVDVGAEVEGDGVDALLAQKGGDLTPPAAPVEQAPGLPSRELAGELPVHEHLRL